MIKMNETIKCNNCGIIIQKPISYFKKQIKNGYKNFYCCLNCQSTFLKNEKLKRLNENTIIKTCKVCNKEFTTINKDSMFCSISCSTTFYNKQFGSRLNDETKLKISKKLKEYYKTNKQYNETEKIIKICPICNKEFKVTNCYKNRIYCSKECYNNDKTLKFRKKVSGGIRVGSGIGKHGWYKGYWCDSSWELAYVIYNLEHNIKFERNKIGFEYEYNKQKLKFYPDFVLNDGTYIEIKGIMNNKNLAKINSFQYKLIVIDKDKIKKYLTYVIEKYGNDFIKLYENNPYNERKNKCLICGEPAKNMYCSRKCSGVAANKRKHNKM
jgi:hypothetical protein